MMARPSRWFSRKINSSPNMITKVEACRQEIVSLQKTYHEQQIMDRIGPVNLCWLRFLSLVTIKVEIILIFLVSVAGHWLA